MKYELTFNEALDVLFNNGGWVQGEHFADGVVLMIDPNSYGGYMMNYPHICNFNGRCWADWKSELRITKGIFSQKYRVVHTQPDAERKV